MATWTLADIRQKVRQVTGRLSVNELSNSQIDTYINKYYQYTFPAEVKLDREHTYYEFLTIANQPYYDMPDGFTNFEPPPSIDNFSMLWYQDPAQFFEENPLQITRLTPWTGDGVTTAFNTTVQAYPIYPGTLVLTDNVEVFQDENTTWTNANVNIVGSLGGICTVNYSTGIVNVNFVVAPDNGQLIYLSYVLFQPGRPTAVLYYNNQFQFFTVPDTAYRFRVKAYAIVDPLVLSTDRPPLDQWGPCIAYGASRDIHSDFGEMDAYAEVTFLYKEQVAYVLNRTTQNLLNTRALPNF